MKTQLSVVVPSYRRRDELDRCLDDLAAQVDPPSLEIVLVLQAFPAGAADALRERFGDRLNLRIAEFAEGLGTGGARNEGLRLSSGDIVAFLDDDVRLPAGWSRALVNCYDDPTVGGAGGFVDHPGHYGPMRNTAYRILGITSNRFKIDWGGFNVGPAFNPQGVHKAEWLGGGNMSFRRHVIVGVNGFDEALGAFWHEDADVTHRVMKSGWKVICSDQLAVDHFPSSVNRPPLRSQVLERERTRVLFVWKAIGDRPLWKARYASRLALHAIAMSVVGLAKGDPMIPVNVIKGGWRGYRELAETRRDSAKRTGFANPAADVRARS
jgi:GT2 family glycosyltransferase